MKKLFMIIILYFTTNSVCNNTQIVYKSVEGDEDEKCEYKGIDISQYQGDVNWSEVNASVDFVICKATEGDYLIDTKFSQNWKNINTHKGAYHFFRPNISGEKQAEIFLNTVTFNKGDIIPIIDVELCRSWNTTKRNISINNLKEMMEYIKDKIGVYPIIYTGPIFWEHYLCGKIDLPEDQILWIADYRKGESPQIPSCFDEYHIWQWTSNGKISGIKGNVDLNICYNINSILIK